MIYSDCDAVAASTTYPIFLQALATTVDPTTMELIELESAEQPSTATQFERGARVDCALMVQGKLLFAHRVLLAKRRYQTQTLDVFLMPSN